jgi:hypothetical protein
VKRCYQIVADVNIHEICVKFERREAPNRSVISRLEIIGVITMRTVLSVRISIRTQEAFILLSRR